MSKKVSRRKKLPVNLTYAKNGTIKVRYKGKTKRGFKSVEDAEIYKAKLILNDETVQSNQTLKLKVVADEFKDFEYQRYLESEITYSTYDKISRLIKNYVIPMFGNVQIFKLNPRKLNEIRVAVFNLDLHSSTKNDILSAVRRSLKHAQIYHDLDKDYSLFLQGFKKTSEEIQKRKERFEHIWTNTDFELFVKNVPHNYHRILFVLFYYHGLRLGEATALFWNRFDKENMTLTIDGSITNKTEKGAFERKSTKNDPSNRTIYIGKDTTNRLIELRSEREKLYGFSDEWYISGSKIPTAQSTVYNLIQATLKKTKQKKIRNHDMRHMFVTNAWSHVPLPALSRYIGHKDVSVTLQEYSHLSQADNEKFNTYIDEIRKTNM